jgi:putative SOS response-associated peptidase YedK
MCGKFTALASWANITAFADSERPITDDDRYVTYRVMNALPVIVWDRKSGQRRVVPMRWGFLDPTNWKSPRPIHARAETVDTLPTFKKLFRDGQRGIVMARTFNEAPDIDGPTRQHTIDPGNAGAMGLAVVWQRFEVSDLPPLLACVMVTVPANRLLAGLPTDRMPAILAEEHWSTWLGENGASPAAAKACLKTVEDVRWTMSREEHAAGTARQKPTVSDPQGLF